VVADAGQLHEHHFDDKFAVLHRPYGAAQPLLAPFPTLKRGAKSPRRPPTARAKLQPIRSAKWIHAIALVEVEANGLVNRSGGILDQASKKAASNFNPKPGQRKAMSINDLEFAYAPVRDQVRDLREYL
jgi:hypothetical protein